jgi:hypothetical protein
MRSLIPSNHHPSCFSQEESMGIFGDGYTYTLFAPLVMETEGAKLNNANQPLHITSHNEFTVDETLTTL